MKFISLEINGRIACKIIIIVFYYKTAYINLPFIRCYNFVEFLTYIFLVIINIYLGTILLGKPGGQVKLSLYMVREKFSEFFSSEVFKLFLVIFHTSWCLHWISREFFFLLESGFEFLFIYLFFGLRSVRFKSIMLH